LVVACFVRLVASFVRLVEGQQVLVGRAASTATEHPRPATNQAALLQRLQVPADCPRRHRALRRDELLTGMARTRLMVRPVRERHQHELGVRLYILSERPRHRLDAHAASARTA
jgi:hypothetical protein